MLVQHRHDIKNGVSDIDFLLQDGWERADDDTRERYEAQYRSMQNAKRFENGPSLEDDVDMGDSDREDTPNGNGAADGAGSFTTVN